MKQTSVEWLATQLEKYYGTHNIKDTTAFDRSKEMEKQQIIDAYAQGFIESENMDRGAEQYYNDTFNK